MNLLYTVLLIIAVLVSAYVALKIAATHSDTAKKLLDKTDAEIALIEAKVETELHITRGHAANATEAEVNLVAVQQQRAVEAERLATMSRVTKLAEQSAVEAAAAGKPVAVVDNTGA
jgi:hypothetical protein